MRGAPFINDMQIICGRRFGPGSVSSTIHT